MLSRCSSGSGGPAGYCLGSFLVRRRFTRRHRGRRARHRHGGATSACAASGASAAAAWPAACMEGMLATSAPYVAVMDADLQHDETMLRAMLERMRQGESIWWWQPLYRRRRRAGLDTHRARTSRWRPRWRALLAKCDLTDPMSGFFMLRRVTGSSVGAVAVVAEGFKILLDIVATAAHAARKGTALLFPPAPARRKQARHAGRLGIRHAARRQARRPSRARALRPLGDRHGRPRRSPRGVGVLWSVLKLDFDLRLYRRAVDRSFTAMTVELLSQQPLHLRDRRLGAWAPLRGLLSFYLICAWARPAISGSRPISSPSTKAWWVAGVAGIPRRLGLELRRVLGLHLEGDADRRY